MAEFRITVDMLESVIPGSHATHSSILGVSFLTLCYYWVAPLSIRGAMGRVVFSAHQGCVDFWSCFVRITEMGPCRHFYVGLHSDDVISRLKEWRVGGLILSRHLLSVLAMSTRKVASISVLASLTVVATAVFGLVPHSVLLLGCAFHDWNM